MNLQSDLAIAISGKIESAIPPARARLTDTPQINAAAYEAYLQGLHDFELRTRPGMERAIAEFQGAIAFDPDYAPAHAALACVYSLTTVVGFMNATESMPKARDAALRAIALDPTLAAGHPVLGFVKCE